MKNQLLRYANYSITFQEVPNEISLVLNITGCTHHCDGCHSDYLAQDFGNYVDDDLPALLDRYKGMITCVCFMGGDQAIDNLREWLKRIKEEYDLKTCVYSGTDDIDTFDNCLDYLDYLKIGPYKKEFGGLDNPNTNQKFYIVVKDEDTEINLFDITLAFIKKYD